MYCVSEFCYVCMNKANRVQCVKSTDTAYEELIHKLHSCQFLVVSTYALTLHVNI